MYYSEQKAIVLLCQLPSFFFKKYFNLTEKYDKIMDYIKIIPLLKNVYSFYFRVSLSILMQILEILKHFYTLSTIWYISIYNIYIQILLHNAISGIKVSKILIFYSCTPQKTTDAFLGKMNVNIKIISRENIKNAAHHFIKSFCVLAASGSILF